VDIDAQAARDSTASDIWWIGMRRLVVVNGPNIFQMLLLCQQPKLPQPKNQIMRL